MALSSIFSKAVSSVKDAVRNVTPAAKNVVATASNMAKRFAPKAYSWDGKSASQMSTLEKTAYLRMNGQKTGAREAFNALADEMRSASSRHYSPYLTGKSNQKEAMEFFGLDRFDQDWLDNNRFLLNYTNQLDWTDTISTSGQAKWSNAQKAGYYWQMLNEAEKTTQEAEWEWKNLRASMQENFNEYKRLYGEAPSYDKLMSFINMNDYSTLQKMDKVYDNVEDLVRLNRSVDYTPETMIGVYAALLNGKDVTGDGDWFEEAVQYTMQPKALPRKQEERLAYSGWTQQQIDQRREEIRRNGTRKQLMEFEADLYASTPHLDSVDSESYFKEAYYDQKFLDKYAYLSDYAEQLRNREGKIEKPASGDPWWYGAAYEYGNIKDKEAVTAAAEKEWDDLRKSLTEAYDPEADPEDVIAFIDWEQYPTLDKLRKGQDVDLNRPVYFSEDALRGVLKAAADGEKTSKDDFDYAYYTTPEAAPRARHEAPEQPTWWTKMLDAALGKGEDGESVSHNHVQTLVDELGYSEGVAQARNMATYLRQSGDVEAAEKLEKQIEEVVRPEETLEPTGEQASEKPAYYVDMHGASLENSLFAPEVHGPMLPDTISPSMFSGKPVTEEPEEGVAEQRIDFLDKFWKDVTGKKTTDAMAIEKAFYEQNGRPMTTTEREQYGLAPLTPDQVPYIEPVLEDMTGKKTTDAAAIEKAFYEQDARPVTGMERQKYGLTPMTIDQVSYAEPVLEDMTAPEKQSIFTDEMNSAASKMINPKTGEGYANMEELLINDPAVIGYMLDYIEAEPQKQPWTQNEVAHLRMLKQYQDKVDSEAVDELFRVYADDNAVEEDRLQASLQYIIESGLTLDEKDRLGLLGRGEDLQLIAQRSQELMVERGNEFSRATAIAMLPKDAPEWLVNTVDAGVSHLFAVETGIAGGVLKTQAAGFNAARDLWSAVNVLHYAVRLGADYTLDEACEIDPVLRGLTAATDQANTVTSIAAPDMSNYSYGAGFTQFVVDSAVGQKTANFYAPAGKSFVSSTTKKLGLGDLGDMMASDGKLRRFVGKAVDAAGGATPWMLRSMSDGAQEARDMGASEADAIRYGAWTGGTTGFIEGVLGQAYDGLLDKGSNLISKGLGRICKGGMSNLAQSKGFAYVTNLLQQAMGESAEGLAEMPLEKIGRSMYLGENFAITGKDWSEAWENARLEGVASIFTSLFFGLTAERNSKTYTDSERFADRLVNGEVNIDELIEYIADPESVPAPREVREAARVIEENQGAVDEAAVEMAAEEVVAQQIDAGALDDINGEASANAQAMRTQEADVQTAQQEVDDLALQIEETDNQKRAALYDMVSNGISTAKGAARQLIHNLDEAKAALVRKQQEASEKLAEKQRTLQLKVEEVDAQIAERLKELKAAATEQVRKELEAARKKADKAVEEAAAALDNLPNSLDTAMYSEVWGANDEYGPRSGSMQEDADKPLNISWNDQVPEQKPAGSTVGRHDIAVDTSNYIPLPLRAEESLRMRQSIQEAIKRRTGKNDTQERDEEPTFSKASEFKYEFKKHSYATPSESESSVDGNKRVSGYVAPEGFEEVSEEDFKKIKDYVNYLARHRVFISVDHFYTHYDTRTENDPIRTGTQGEYTTLARSNDGRYVMLFSTVEWKNYNDAMKRYRETDSWLKDEYRKLDQITDKAERDKMRAYLDQERADNAKPDTPRGSYRIIDTSRIAADDARDTGKLYSDEVIKRIDSRIRKLELKNELLKQRGVDGVDIDRVSERIDVLKALKERASAMGPRRFEARMNQLYENGDEKNLTVQEIRTLLDNMPGFERTENEAAKRLRQMTVSILSNKNQANDVMEKLSGENGYESYSSEAIHYASTALLDALSDVDSAYDEKGNLVPELFVELHPDLFYYEDSGANAEEKWIGSTLEQRLATHYTSPLADANDKYTAIDSSSGVNLVVAKNDTRIDPAQTGDVLVNPDIHSVADATEALQRVLDETNDLMKQQAEAYAPNWVKEKGVEPKLYANQRRYYAGNVIYSVRNAEGELINRAVTAFVDPKTGEKRWPSAADLLAVAERVTVNYTHYDVYYPTKFEYFDKKDGEYQTRTKMSPDRYGGQDRYSFTLEKSSLAPEYRFSDDGSAASDASYHEPSESLKRVDDEFNKAERDFAAFAGENVPSEVAAEYFLSVCDANYTRHIRMAAEASRRLEASNATDQELLSLRERIKEHQEAAVTWRYIGTQISAAVAEQDNGTVGKVLKKYNDLLKENGSASLQARLKLASTLRRSMSTIHRNQLKAEIPADATLETLQARRDELVSALEDVMNSRNQPPVAGMATPSATNNEPLTQAIMEAIDLVDKQVEIVSSRPAEEPQITPEAAAEEVQAPEEEPVESPSAAPDEVSQNPENVTDAKTEEADPVTKQQEMDRAYLEAVVNPEPEAEEKPDMVDMETGEFVKNDEAMNGEFANSETGEIEYREDIPAEELSWIAPVEEYMKRAGLDGVYDDVEINSRSSHDQVEQQAEHAYAAALSLTRRIDEMQIYLKSGLASPEDVDAIRQTMQTYIKERNRLKAVAKQKDEQLMRSDYTSKKTIDSIAQHSVETGEIPWEELEGRRDDISAVYDNEIEGMRTRMNERLYAGKTSVLTMNDIAYIIGSDELTNTLQRNFETAQSIMSEVHYREKLLKDAQEQLAKLDEDTRKNGMTLENEALRGKLVSRINLLETEIENGRKTARTFYDSGSELSLEDILSGSEGGTLPLNVMNRIFAILKDVDAHSKTTNRKTGILSDFDNPLRVMEHFAGEWAPVLNAIYFGNIQSANAALKRERGDIVEKLKNSGINHKNSADAMRYAEGKMTEEELEQKYPDPSERNAIRRGVQVYRDVYETLWQEVNSALIANGFDPIPHRKNYVHHVKEARSAIANACSMLGIRITEDELPTSLAGHTEELKPRRGHMNAAMERHGDDTRYDLERNTMAYVDAALRVIHHTGNISRLRQLEGIADQTVNKRMKNAGLNQYGDLVNTDDLKRPGRSNRTAFSSLREWVTEYTNLLAGKQSLYDRPLEHAGNRNYLQVANGLKGMVGSSIVVGNLNIATTNILPVMTMAGIAPAQTAAAIADVVAGGREGLTSFEAQSDFLTARFADQQFDMNWVDALTGKVMIPFEAIDRFVANVVVRAYQKMGMKKGWSPEVAMKWADQMAWRMMVSKNLGEGANIQSAKGLGIALQFSREGINNLQFLTHDLPAISSGTGDWLKKLLGIMLGGWLYNAAFNKTTALEPVTPTLQSVREWDSDKLLLENLGNAAGNYAEMLNPTNLGTGGDLDNIPLVSAVGDMGKAAWNMAGAAMSGDGAGVASGLDDFFTATLGFVPGGLTIDRIRGAIGDYYRGYTTDDKGNIKFTIDNDLFSAGSIHDAIFTLLLSESGTLGGREYTRSGYEKMTSTQTEAFHNQKDQGKSNQEAFDAVKGYAEARGNNDARGMILPDWATAEVDSDWMQAVIAEGSAAYPSKAPDSLTVDGVKYELSDEEKTAFDSSYKTAYKMHIQGAMKRGESLKKAADKAYRAALNRFKEKLEG